MSDQPMTHSSARHSGTNALPCYVVNLDRAAERLRHTEIQFARVGHRFTRVAAVDGKCLTEEQLEGFRRSSRFHRRWANSSQFAVLLSHIRVWQQIARGEGKYAAVFEDDVHLSDAIGELLRDCRWIPEVADIIRFETTRQGMRLGRDEIHSVSGLRIYRVRSGAWGAAGYAISREIAAWLANIPPRFHMPVDYILFHKSSPISRFLTVFQFDPALCVQDLYHPDPAVKANFDSLGKELSSNETRATSRLKTTLRSWLRPAFRSLTARRAVEFADTRQIIGKSKL